MKNLVFLLFVVVLGTGCTTLNKGDNTQSVRIVSNPAGADVFFRGKELGKTPMFISLSRQCSDQDVELRLDDEKQSISIQSKYRWRDSFFSNLVFMGLAPIGWGIDLGSCSAFRFKPPKEAKFSKSEKWKKGDVSKVGHEIIVVAPPLGVSNQSTLSLGNEIVRRLRIKFLDSKVVEYNESASVFISEGVDSFTKGNSDSRNSVYQAFMANRVIDAVVREKKNDLLITFRLRDVFTGRLIKKWKETYRKLDIPGYEEKKFVKSLRQNIFWVPNTLSFDFGGANASVKINGDLYEGESAKEEGGWNEFFNLIGSVGLRYLEPPSYSSQWKWKFVWVPSVSANWGRVAFKQAPGIEDLPISTRGVVVGYGPEIQYRSFYGQLYANIVPGLGYQYISYSENNKKHVFQGGFAGLIVEMGYLYFFNKNWNFRIFSRSTSAHNMLWEELMESRPSPQDIESATNVYGGISVGYSFSLSRIFSSKSGE